MQWGDRLAFPADVDLVAPGEVIVDSVDDGADNSQRLVQQDSPCFAGESCVATQAELRLVEEPRRMGRRRLLPKLRVALERLLLHRLVAAPKSSCEKARTRVLGDARQGCNGGPEWPGTPIGRELDPPMVLDVFEQLLERRKTHAVEDEEQHRVACGERRHHAFQHTLDRNHVPTLRVLRPGG